MRDAQEGVWPSRAARMAEDQRAWAPFEEAPQGWRVEQVHSCIIAPALAQKRFVKQLGAACHSAWAPWQCTTLSGKLYLHPKITLHARTQTIA